VIIPNEAIRELTAEIPEGHKHIRITLSLEDGRDFTFQEAAIANLVRAYIAVKTHPTNTKIIMKGARLESRKQGYAEWQLLEDDSLSPG
jgi:hypothetical protein